LKNGVLINIRCLIIAKLLKDWRDGDQYAVLKGWRDELYAVWGYDETPLLLIERSAIAIFGARSYGVHINGYVPTSTGFKTWVFYFESNSGFSAK
jgi:hypothetical protein